MKITTQEIIQVLPISQQIKDSLTQQWASMDADTRFDLEQIIWDAYDTLFDIALEENIKLELMKASQEEVKLDDTFYQRMNERTELQMQQKQLVDVDSAQLADIRGKLEAYMQSDTTHE